MSYLRSALVVVVVAVALVVAVPTIETTCIDVYVYKDMYEKYHARTHVNVFACSALYIMMRYRTLHSSSCFYYSVRLAASTNARTSTRIGTCVSTSTSASTSASNLLRLALLRLLVPVIVLALALVLVLYSTSTITY
jgi:hypothetical protein